MQITKVMAILAIVTLPLAAQADTLSEDRVKELVLEAIRENPEIVLEAVQIIEQREQQRQAAAAASVLSDNRDVLENDPNAPVLGNPDGDVTVVEFFDYNCPYCRRVKPEIEALLAEDPNVKLVYREWPILGEGSVFAARAALAAREQGKYEEFHWALMGMQGRAEEASVIRVAEEVGLDIAQLRRDMQAPEIDDHISASMEMSRDLGFNGTPSFVIGDALVPGVIDADQMIRLTEEARAAKQ
ncbi:thioredoxin domain-containing protein [Epibacterium sp. SM1979]|uniref:Thioredoxin domain-containing protein n=1 Tax=Tritonibacter litoralis TaxID=2662264 RepID=A0A843YMU0_9RHOB|nr:DsbA family protein [Tritonibacter litoralis]MQQ10503.1 thioredoxin domain-containing protein [Tritonibacter litoralis]